MMARRLVVPVRGGLDWRLAAVAGLILALLGLASAQPGRVGAAACVVNSTADSGAGTLREKVDDPTCDSITFALPNPSTITLTSAYLLVNRNLTIQGPAANQLTVARSSAGGTPVFTVFYVASGTVAISGLTISGGAGTSSDGGGIYNLGNLMLTGVAVRDNAAADDGGGIYSEGTLAVAGSTISGNEAPYGGGISSEGTLTITNSTIAGNSAEVHGGGLDNFYGGTATVENSTIAGNSSGTGANIITHDDGAVTTLRRSIVAGGIGGANCVTQGDATIANGDYNVDSGASCGFGSTNGSISSANPWLAALGSYGGPTQTMALLPGSPAIDRVPASGAGCPAADQRAIARPQPGGGSCDSGAFESRGFTMTLFAGNNQSAVINTAFAGALVVAVASDFGEPVLGGRVTFTGPASGAGIQGSPLADSIDGSGHAGVIPVANGTTGGPYTVAASAAGVATGVNFSLTNVAIPTTLVADAATGVYTGTVNLRATLTATSGGAGIAGKTIVFSLNGAMVCGGGGQPGCPTTNGSGVATLDNVALAGIGAGSYPAGVGASSAGDATYAAASDTAALTVDKAATALTQVRGNATYGDATGNLTATLRRTNGDGGPVAGAMVLFTINGVPVGGATTNAQGVAVLTGVAVPAGLNAGSYANAVGASYAGDGNHLATSASGPLRVARKILWLKPVNRTVGLRQANPPTTPPAGCVAQQTPTSACWLELANGSGFVNGDDWGDLNLGALRFQYNRNPPSTNATEYLGKTYRITAFGAASANYDIRYQFGTLTVVAAP